MQWGINDLADLELPSRETDLLELIFPYAHVRQK